MFHLENSRPVVGKANTKINKPVYEVFRFVGEKFFDNYPKWALEVTEFKPLTGALAFKGAKAQQTRLEHGQKIESVFEIAEFDPPKKVILKGIDAAFLNTYQFSSDDGQQTALEFSFEIIELDFFMRPFEKLIRIAIEEGAENTVENIKNLLADEPNKPLSGQELT